MNNFNQRNEKKESSIEFESFDFNTLENQSEYISSTERAEIEQGRDLETHNNREELLSIYESHESRDRDISPFESNKRSKIFEEENNNNTIFLDEYRSDFATYSDRDDYDLRVNNSYSQDYLDESIELTKSEEKVIPLSKKTANIGKAALVTLGISKIS